jgi:hypothetical protein
MAPKRWILGLAWLDPYQGLQWEDAKLSKKMEQLDLPLGNSKSPSSCFLLLAPYGKGERAPPSSNPYLLWMKASRWSPWPSLAASLLQSLLLSFSFSCLSVRECRERWTREREKVQEWMTEPFYEPDRWAVKCDQVISPSDTSQFCMGWLYRTLRRGGGLSDSVGELTDGV